MEQTLNEIVKWTVIGLGTAMLITWLSFSAIIAIHFRRIDLRACGTCFRELFMMWLPVAIVGYLVIQIP